jgi:DNA-binding PadR family transcriptional regulator
LETNGFITSKWGESENKRRARYYSLTAQGRKRLEQEAEGWNRLVNAIAAALSARAEEM